jgi:AraC-like DNA-binding protein/quercetin dioxygenase-like cupin family protein
MPTHLVFESPVIPLPGVVMFGRYQLAASMRGLGPHAHRDAVEICFLERGEQTYRVADRVYRLTGGDQFVTFPGEVHDTANLPQERGILYWLILDLKATGDFLGLSPAYARRLRRGLAEMASRHFRADPRCAPLLGQAIKVLSASRPVPQDSGETAFRCLQLQSLLLEFLVLTVRSSRLGVQGTASPLLQRVLEYIGKNLETPVQVALLAKVARLSESRLKARFRREIGVPPAEYWLRQKIERASSLLQEASVTEVAYRLGFSSSQYFATVFKRYTLATPSQVRQASRTTPGHFRCRGSKQAVREN